jgi:hypothetical protein
MRSEHDTHRNKPFITNNTLEGLLVKVDVMGHQRETLICMILNMAPALDTAMVMGPVGAALEEEDLPYLCLVPLLVAFCWVTL